MSRALRVLVTTTFLFISIVSTACLLARIAHLKSHATFRLSSTASAHVIGGDCYYLQPNYCPPTNIGSCAGLGKCDKFGGCEAFGAPCGSFGNPNVSTYMAWQIQTNGEGKENFSTNNNYCEADYTCDLTCAPDQAGVNRCVNRAQCAFAQQFTEATLSGDSCSNYIAYGANSSSGALAHLNGIGFDPFR